MDPREFYYENEYNLLIHELEISEKKYGLTNRKTLEISQKLDSVLNEIMRIKYPRLKQLEQIR
ncbi:aspartyl-phosphate phosphatase Spo0E family protein [Bacillus sp. AFS031507]|uniref:aspartyl-phosphate phosphatase Spo0E family protein n=1 Tax=Bacillus sp. AFS031507 TaxID=2033496 RepID=UPI000BFD56A7|nr:aspartyl-phosphate phosphatase Spo0E family protein [Bacillus sp. AFS031507]PGY12961.1 Spo0E family sporulation regulatory protein-aspartic acid phosphatase [Bacillus sp. AFS031507]